MIFKGFIMNTKKSSATVFTVICIRSIDYCGINYYSREKAIKIIERLKERKPEEFEILLDWLLSDLKYNGFYILGV
jgi:hypothetical protein